MNITFIQKHKDCILPITNNPKDEHIQEEATGKKVSGYIHLEVEGQI